MVFYGWMVWSGAAVRCQVVSRCEHRFDLLLLKEEAQLSLFLQNICPVLLNLTIALSTHPFPLYLTLLFFQPRGFIPIVTRYSSGEKLKFWKNYNKQRFVKLPIFQKNIFQHSKAATNQVKIQLD